MGRYSYGQPVRRVEDHRFITGTGRYAEDVMPDDMCHAVFFRSPVAHARITALDVTGARNAPGVLAVYTGEDCQREGMTQLPIRSDFKSRDGTQLRHPAHPPLAHEFVRYAGQCVAVVIAQTRNQAEDARELIHFEFEELAVVTDAVGASAAGAVQLHADCPNNLCYDWENGDEAACRAALDASEHVVEFDIYNSRICISPMENRGSVSSIDHDTGFITLEGAVQNVFTFRSLLAGALGDDESNFRVVAPDVGGGFGAKNQLQSEHVMITYGCKNLKRPVSWTNTRSETFISDSHGRHVHHKIRMGFSGDHKITALHVETLADMGAYLSTNGPIISTAATAAVLGGPYTIPSLYLNVKGYFSNTTPTDAYRGAGRPEANFITERLIEVAARQLDVDPVELRQKNLIADAALPYTNGFGKVIDSGAFPTVLEKALSAADVSGFEARAKASRAAGKLRGFGVACYLESTLGGPSENARIEVVPEGPVRIIVGSQSNGQSHETVFSQLVADKLGIDIERIEFSQADTADPVPNGGGHGGSRSLQIAGSAIHGATQSIIEKGRRVAAEVLEAAAADVEFDADAGEFTITGTDRRVTLDNVAAAASRGVGLEDGEDAALNELNTYEREAFTYPNGCHTIEIEIDPDTGHIDVLDYRVVDDFGKIVNPMVVEGQIVGGIVQGLGQATLEHTVYDDNGQLLSGTFMDYCLPRADDYVGAVGIEFHEDSPPETNPLGIKGCGEAGCVGSTVAMVNAVVNALHAAGVKNADHIEMPITPDRLWRTIAAGAVSVEH